MKEKDHLEAFEEHKSTIFKWALESFGIEKSQRIVGLHASRGIVELLSAYLHNKRLVDDGFQLNHRWFKTDKISYKLPDFKNKAGIIKNMVELEQLSEKLSYGSPQPPEKTEKVLTLFKSLENEIRRMIEHG